MADSLFDIFGDNMTTQYMKNTRLPNIENMGKPHINNGPIKPSESLKKAQKGGQVKKSFLSNIGATLQSTPMRTPFSPRVFTPASAFTPRSALAQRAVNIASLIYSDADNKPSEEVNFEQFEFTKPSHKYDNYYSDLIDYLPMQTQTEDVDKSPIRTPSPSIEKYSMEFESSYEDEFFKDDFCDDILEDSDLSLPDIY